MTAVAVVPGAVNEAARRAAARLIRIAGEALPPELAHLAEGSLAEALGKAVDYARHSISPTTEKIYADDWAVNRRPKRTPYRRAIGTPFQRC
jgi:hypothetical protein